MRAWEIGRRTVTEVEWVDCTEPDKMLEFLRGNPIPRERDCRRSQKQRPSR